MTNEESTGNTLSSKDSEFEAQITPGFEIASTFLANQLSVIARIDGVSRDYSNPVSGWFYRLTAKPKSLISVLWDRKRVAFNNELNMLAFAKDAAYLCMLVAEHLRSPEIDVSEKILKSAESILKTDYLFVFQATAKLNIFRLVEMMVKETLGEKKENRLPHVVAYIDRYNMLVQNSVPGSAPAKNRAASGTDAAKREA